MKLRTTPATNGTPRSLGVVMLSLWLAGIGCLIGCCAPQVIAAAAPAQAEEALAPTACPHHAQGGEVARTGDNLASRTTPQPFAPLPHTRTMACCPLAGLPTLVTSKTCPDHKRPVTATLARFSPPTTHEVRLVASAAASIRIHDRGGTYLLCCVFLI